MESYVCMKIRFHVSLAETLQTQAHQYILIGPQRPSGFIIKCTVPHAHFPSLPHPHPPISSCWMKWLFLSPITRQGFQCTILAHHEHETEWDIALVAKCLGTSDLIQGTTRAVLTQAQLGTTAKTSCFPHSSFPANHLNAMANIQLEQWFPIFFALGHPF